MKKNCLRCRAENDKPVCELGHKRRLVVYLGKFIPDEQCRKPTTFKALDRLKQLTNR